MTPRRLVVLAMIAILAPALVNGQNFDRLDESDRQAFQRRFEKEIWPLLTRGGKDSCMSCHQKGAGSLRLRGDAGKDFVYLLKEGFFLRDDAGSLLARVSDKDKKRRMPPGLRAAWTDAEVSVLRAFVIDVDKKQKK